MEPKSAYILEKNGQYYAFFSEENACDFLGVSKKQVAIRYCMRKRIRGYNIIRALTESSIYADKRLNGIWHSMKRRCYNPKHPHYDSYGGRGIGICNEWLESYVTFAKWAFKNGYKDGLTIDRLDNNKGYSPTNCKWSTYQEQGNNRVTNRIVEYKGEKYTMITLARKAGIKKTTFKERLNRGWSVEDAVEIPVGSIKGSRKKAIILCQT